MTAYVTIECNNCGERLPEVPARTLGSARVFRSIGALWSFNETAAGAEDLCSDCQPMELTLSPEWERFSALLRVDAPGTRALNSLLRQGLRSVSAVREAEDGDLLAIRTLGNGGVARIRAALVQLEEGA